MVKQMSGKCVPRGSTATFKSVEGDLEVSRHAVVKGEGSPPEVEVSGTIYVNDDCVFDCNLSGENLEGEGEVTVKGNVEIRNRIDVDDGRLHVSGNLSAKRACIGRSLKVEKDLKVDRVDVGGKLEVGGKTEALTIDVGGKFVANGLVKTKSIDVGGAVRVDAEVDVEDNIDVGGAVSVCGGKVNKVNVGGSLVSKDALRFEKIDVGGSVKLAGGSTGGSIDVGGVCKVEGDLRFEDIEVGGVAVIAGSAEGANLDVGGKVRVDGSINLSGHFDVGGKAEIDGMLKAQRVEVGGSLRAREAKVESRVTVGGSIETDDGVYASYVEVGRRGKVKGPINADEVFIGRGARVEDISAKEITLEREVEARNLRGESIRLGARCKISGEVKYTKTLEADRDVKFAKEPQKEN